MSKTMEDKPLSRPISLLAWLVNNLSGAIADLAVFLNNLIQRATIALLLRKEQHEREDEEQAD